MGLVLQGGYDNKWAEYIFRSSITDKALLLALLLNEKPISHEIDPFTQKNNEASPHPSVPC
ncbi:hypothetical protein JCM21142_104406 [Saccharicrinis fermentans DSM 9555 = JCM 21142]|uniref:Uncharacterized protein n=1 Tax=Saccharicrinis fermentans DSM 9555 = JCM 21142 TaxID=869213 RepID=W7YLY5_9BACT|nr:hypothetical protein JCM21142_104406 [Saccharicrinis fermentans DSM 9555 = JCM 21142]